MEGIMKRITAIVVGILCLTVAQAQAASLYESYSRKSSVPFFVESVTDSSKDKKVDVASLKAGVEKALIERKSIKFKKADNPETAQLKIAIDVKEYYWSDHDPVDMIVGVGAVAMDAAMIESYAFMQADVSITDDKGKALWSENIISTITKKDMSADDARGLIGDDFAKSFIKSAFSKKRA